MNETGRGDFQSKEVKQVRQRLRAKVPKACACGEDGNVAALESFVGEGTVETGWDEMGQGEQHEEVGWLCTTPAAFVPKKLQASDAPGYSYAPVHSYVVPSEPNMAPIMPANNNNNNKRIEYKFMFFLL